MAQFFLLIISVFVLMLPVSKQDLTPALSEGQHVYTLWGESFISLNNRFLIYLPVHYLSQPDKSWPLLIYLHGASERGTNPSLIKKAGPPMEAVKRDFPMIILSPQCLPKNRWNPIELNQFVQKVIGILQVDPNRIYLTGKSMGGFGAWDFATQFPDRFAAIVPISGGGDTTQAVYLAGKSVWAFHGAKDQVVPVSASREMVDAVNRAGGKAKLTIYPNAGHNVWDKTYSNPNIYEWLLQQTK